MVSYAAIHGRNGSSKIPTFPADEGFIQFWRGYVLLLNGYFFNQTVITKNFLICLCYIKKFCLANEAKFCQNFLNSSKLISPKENVELAVYSMPINEISLLYSFKVTATISKTIFRQHPIFLFAAVINIVVLWLVTFLFHCQQYI